MTVSFHIVSYHIIYLGASGGCGADTSLPEIAAQEGGAAGPGTLRGSGGPNLAGNTTREEKKSTREGKR